MLISSLLIAIAYFAIPIALLPIARRSSGSLRDSITLACLFIFSCGIGHLLEGFHSPFMMPWHWVTASISWVFLAEILANRQRLLELYESFVLLGVSWDESIVAKMLFERVNDDLKLIKANKKALDSTNNKMYVGAMLCEELPNHRAPVYPYTEPLIDKYLATSGSQTLEFRFQGDTIDAWFLNICVDLPMTDYIYMNFIDISEIKDASLKDTLTKLFNRRILENEDGRWTCCLYLDLDKFKQVNDTRGHPYGDKVLMEVGRILELLASENKGLAIREGGDEFLLLIGENYDQCEAIAAKCLSAIQEIRLDSEKQLISASIGVACGEIKYFLDCDRQLDRLILAAETASRKAKANKKSDTPKDRIVLWSDMLGEQLQGTYSIEMYLRSEKVSNELWLAYQPIVNMITGEIVGSEALLRWQSPQLGFVSPAKFIPIAENSGLIFGLSSWVLHNALAQLQKWQLHTPNFSVSVNISPRELEDIDFVDNISKLIAKYGIKQGTLGIEVTERGIYENLETYLGNLQQLKATSITLKIDDFGIGESGLSKLIEFPFKEVKVDISLVPTSIDDHDKIAICRAIAQLARDLDFDTIVEGIETKEQADLLIELGFTVAQGYYFYKPMPKDRITELLKAEN